MDDSVIEIDDSIISIASDGDVEEGEVNESDVDLINISAKTETDSKQSEECENEIFELKFRHKDDFEKLHERLIGVFQQTFEESDLVFETNTKNATIVAKTKSETPLPDDDLFLIDTAPTIKLNAAHVPSYKRVHADVLDEDTPARKKQKAEAVNKCYRPRMQSACFNCGGVDHSLRECTRPRNQARIQRARKKTSRTERYHVDTEQRFAHIRPGKISSKTRHAMGFSRGELPFMFYRMRVLGYPPAWLEEAKVQSSGITLFNADGSEVQAPEQEEGESDSFKYDVNKIIDFPGFNVQPGAKFYDDFQHHNVPKFQEHQLKANFIKSLGENITKAYKRKKLLALPNPHDTTNESSTNFVEHDMELDDDAEDDMAVTTQPPLPTEPCIPAPPPPPPAEAPEAPPPPPPPRTPSPSLEDLREQQAQLLQQLESNTSLNASSVCNESATQIETETEASSTSSTTPKASIFRASFEGTPLLKFSEFDKLPIVEKFKVGVSDVINFENLPDSTGKYEQMKGLLKDVRQKMEKLQNAED